MNRERALASVKYEDMSRAFDGEAFGRTTNTEINSVNRLLEKGHVESGQTEGHKP